MGDLKYARPTKTGLKTKRNRMKAEHCRDGVLPMHPPISNNSVESSFLQRITSGILTQEMPTAQQPPWQDQKRAIMAAPIVEEKSSNEKRVDNTYIISSRMIRQLKDTNDRREVPNKGR